MTGAIEIIGGIFVLVPSVQFLGGILLTCTMIGAFLTHVRAGELGALPVPFVIGTLTGVLVWISRPLRKA